MFNLEFIKVVKQIVIEDRSYLENHLNFRTWCSVNKNNHVGRYSVSDVNKNIAAHCGTTFCLAGYLHYLFRQKDKRLSSFEFDSLSTGSLSRLIYIVHPFILGEAYLTAFYHKPDYDAMIERINYVLKHNNVPHPYMY